MIYVSKIIVVAVVTDNNGLEIVIVVTIWVLGYGIWNQGGCCHGGYHCNHVHHPPSGGVPGWPPLLVRLAGQGKCHQHLRRSCCWPRTRCPVGWRDLSWFLIASHSYIFSYIKKIKLCVIWNYFKITHTTINSPIVLLFSGLLDSAPFG